MSFHIETFRDRTTLLVLSVPRRSVTCGGALRHPATHKRLRGNGSDLSLRGEILVSVVNFNPPTTYRMKLSSSFLFKNHVILFCVFICLEIFSDIYTHKYIYKNILILIVVKFDNFYSNGGMEKKTITPQ